MFAWKWKKPNAVPPGLCGLRFASDGIAFAYVTRETEKEKKPLLRYCNFISCQRNNREETLSAIVDANHLQGVGCAWILAPGAYRLLSLAPLPVAPEEMLSAIRWHIKDKIDFPVEEATVDYFTLPHQGRAQAEDLIYVIAAKTDYLARRSDLIRAAGLDIKYIDIPELVYRNIGELYESTNGIGLVGLRKGEGILLIIRQNALYMIRRLDLKLSPSSAATALSDAEKLAMEIQRSLGYYEDQLGQKPLAKLLIAPPYDDVLPFLKENLSVEVSGMDIRHVLSSLVELTLDKEIRCPEAIGGALRREEVHAAAN